MLFHRGKLRIWGLALLSKVSADILVLGLSNVNFSELISQHQQHRPQIGRAFALITISVKCHIRNGTTSYF